MTPARDESYQHIANTLQFCHEQLTLCKQAIGSPSVNEYTPYILNMHVKGAAEHAEIALEMLAIYGYTPDPVAAPESVDELSSLIAEREAERETEAVIVNSYIRVHDEPETLEMEILELPSKGWIRITGAMYDTMWYATQIGKVFEVRNVCSMEGTGNNDAYEVARSDVYYPAFVYFSDCEPVSEPAPSSKLSDRERELLRQARIAYDFFKTQYPHLVILAELERAIEAYGERVRS